MIERVSSGSSVSLESSRCYTAHYPREAQALDSLRIHSENWLLNSFSCALLHAVAAARLTDTIHWRPVWERCTRRAYCNRGGLSHRCRGCPWIGDRAVDEFMTAARYHVFLPTCAYARFNRRPVDVS